MFGNTYKVLGKYKAFLRYLVDDKQIPEIYTRLVVKGEIFTFVAPFLFKL